MIRLLKRLSAQVSLLVLVLLASPVLSYAQTIEYYHLDALGSVRAVSNEGGVVVERHDYLPFGEEDLSSGGSQTVRFAGQERDAETGLDYFGARYYAARSGRFTTIDPIVTLKENLVDPQRWNRYAYVRNNPLRYIDPDGRWFWSLLDIGLSANDARETVQTWRDPNSSTWDRGASVVGTVIGAG